MANTVWPRGNLRKDFGKLLAPIFIKNKGVPENILADPDYKTLCSLPRFTAACPTLASNTATQLKNFCVTKTIGLTRKYLRDNGQLPQLSFDTVMAEVTGTARPPPPVSSVPIPLSANTPRPLKRKAGVLSRGYDESSRVQKIPLVDAKKLIVIYTLPETIAECRYEVKLGHIEITIKPAFFFTKERLPGIIPRDDMLTSHILNFMDSSQDHSLFSVPNPSYTQIIELSDEVMTAPGTFDFNRIVKGDVVIAWEWVFRMYGGRLQKLRTVGERAAVDIDAGAKIGIQNGSDQ